MNVSEKMKDILLDKIKKLARDPKKFLKDPKRNFTRKRKFDLTTVLKFIICMEASSIKDELYKYFGLSIDNPTASAFIIQRQKIKPEAFEWLLKEFNEATRDHSSNMKFNGYRLIAIDGSTLPISYNSSDSDTLSNEKDGRKGYNAFHMTASYDLLEHTYDDLIIQGEAKKNEFRAFNELVDRYNSEPATFIADRGFGSYNSFTHVIKSNNKFLIRIRDINSRNSIAKGLDLGLDGEFDINIKRILTFRNTNEIKAHPEIYRFMSTTSNFDYMNKENPFYEFECRIVRFKITEDTYEVIATNLDRNKFDSKIIKQLYNMRWGIETSFRELKYAIGMNAFHAKNRDSIKQEIHARILLYNLSERIIRKVKPKKVKNRKKNYLYQINFTRAFHNILTYLKIKDGESPPDIEAIIAKEIEPIRPGRSDPRKIRHQGMVFFTYRFI